VRLFDGRLKDGWKHVDSDVFHVLTGVRQGGVLSPYFFRLYVRDMIQQVTQMKVGCNIGDTMINLLCFADDMVLLAVLSKVDDLATFKKVEVHAKNSTF